MKKLITFLFTIIFITSITACSESPDKLYGYYKNINEKRNRYGDMLTYQITPNKIGFKTPGSLDYPIETPYKKGNSWFVDSSKNHSQLAEFKVIDEKTIEIIFENKSLGKYVKITAEEFEHIRNNPVRPKPRSLF